MTLVSLQLVGTFLTYFIILYQFQSSERGTGQWTFPLKSAIKFYFNVHILHIIRFIWRTQTIQLHRYHGNTISKISRIVSLWIPCRILETGREWWRTSMKWQSAVWINRYELGRTFNHVMHLRWAVISGQPGRDPMRLFRAMTGECELWDWSPYFIQKKSWIEFEWSRQAAKMLRVVRVMDSPKYRELCGSSYTNSTNVFRHLSLLF